MTWGSISRSRGPHARYPGATNRPDEKSRGSSMRGIRRLREDVEAKKKISGKSIIR